jgi:hypothetical protein
MKTSLGACVASVLALAALSGAAGPQQPEQPADLFDSSLHHTSRGMGFWYDRKNGGLEILTGVPYSQLGCKNCHVASCDSCHRTVVEGKPAYSTKAARDQSLCLKCHGREAAVMKADKAQGHEDVHVAKGLQCMDCHTGRDVHGDGTEYASMTVAGAISPKCETCHAKVGTSVAHTVHGGKLDCKACHVRQVVSCTNCHFETLLKTGQRVAVPVSGWLFLMNSRGKVTSANMQTFVVGEKKTFLMFAPQFSHSVTKSGRPCEACHGTDEALAARSKHVKLLWLDKGAVQQAQGVIPVAAGAKYGLVFQNFRDGKWSVIQNPAEPLLQYAGYGEPLTDAQVAKLAAPRHAR